MTVHARRGHRVRDTEQSSIFLSPSSLHTHIYESNTILYTQKQNRAWRCVRFIEEEEEEQWWRGFVYSEFSTVLNFRVLTREKGMV